MGNILTQSKYIRLPRSFIAIHVLGDRQSSPEVGREPSNGEGRRRAWHDSDDLVGFKMRSCFEYGVNPTGIFSSGKVDEKD